MEAQLATSRAARGRGGPSKFYRSDARRRQQLAGQRAQTFLSEELDIERRKEILQPDTSQSLNDFITIFLELVTSTASWSQIPFTAVALET